MADKDKILLVTGASSDVGIALLKKIYRSYSRIYVQYRNKSDALKQLIERMKECTEVIEVCCDFDNDMDIQNLLVAVTEPGFEPDHFVHLPSPNPGNAYFQKKSIEDFRYGWRVSVESCILVLQSILPHMASQKYGRVLVMLSSITAGVAPKFLSDYVTAKYALLGLMKSLSIEYAARGVTFNGVSPDMMNTKFLAGYPHLVVETYAESKATKRNVEVSEILPIMEYILSEESASMTGQNICIGEA